MHNKKLKCINYLGKTYAVPEWVQFVAQEMSSEIWGFENKPFPSEEDGSWDLGFMGGQCCKIRPAESFQIIEEWNKTLVEVSYATSKYRK